MIGFLRGVLMVKKPPFLLLDVHGVGYDLQASMNTFYQLPMVGEQVALYTHFVVREDAQLLYGFHSEQERAVFREIIKVSGIGAKLALTVLSGMNINELLACITARNASQLERIPGIGKKTAERLIVEMQGRLEKQLQGNLAVGEGLLPSNTGAEQVVQDAIDALIALGYKPPEASKAILKVSHGANDSETLIRTALQNLGKI